MTLYDIGLFLHVAASLSLFAAIGLEWVGLNQLKKAETAESAQAVCKMIEPIHRLFPISGATLLISGIYMSVTAWGFPAWIVVSLALLLAIASTGRSVTGVRLTAIGELAAAERGALSSKLQMGTIITVVVSVLVGLLWSLPILTASRSGKLPV